jgi:hypothetical protein
MTPDNDREAAARYEYRIVREHSHEDLQDKINDMADDGWQPVNAYAWNRDINNADHACLMRKAKS